MRNWGKTALCCAMACALISIWAGCSSRQPEASHPEPDALALPWPGDSPAQPRSASATSVITGYSYDESSGDVRRVHNSAQFWQAATPSWAMYEAYFDELSYPTPIKLYYSEHPAIDGAELFIGIANYQRQAWDFYAAEGDPAVFDLAEPLNYLSPDGVMHLVAVNQRYEYAQVDYFLLETGGEVAEPRLQVVEDPPELAPGVNIRFVGTPEQPAWEVTAVFKLRADTALPASIWYDIDGDPSLNPAAFNNDIFGKSCSTAGVHADTLTFSPEDIQNYIWQDGDEVFIVIRCINHEGMVFAAYTIPLRLELPAD